MDNQDQPPSSAPKKVRIKAGAFEFEAEGSIEDYRESLEGFFGLVEKVMPAMAPITGVSAAAGAGSVTPATSTANSSPPADPQQPQDPANPASQPQTPSPLGEDVLARLYRRDGEGISLLALPRSDDGGADAIIALLYGFNKLLNRSAVTGVALMKAAKQSGVSIPRVDTTMAKRQDYVLAAGARRGRVYSLNNRGVQYAESVLRRTLE